MRTFTLSLVLLALAACQAESAVSLEGSWNNARLANCDVAAYDDTEISLSVFDVDDGRGAVGFRMPHLMEAATQCHSSTFAVQLDSDEVIGGHEQTCDGDSFWIEVDLIVAPIVRPLTLTGTMTLLTPDDESVTCDLTVTQRATQLSR